MVVIKCKNEECETSKLLGKVNMAVNTAVLNLPYVKPGPEYLESEAIDWED